MNFLSRLSEIINTSQSRSIVLTGNIHDLFFDGKKYVPLIQLLLGRYNVNRNDQSKGITRIVYEINDHIVVVGADRMAELESVWKAWGQAETLQSQFDKSKGNATFALELLRQLTVCVRQNKAAMTNNLLIIIEGADLLVPECEISRMNMAERQRIAILHDWFSDPEFVGGHDSVILLSESRSMLHHRVAKLPQILEVETLLPDTAQRQHFIQSFGKLPEGSPEGLEVMTAGLSIHALRQLLSQKTINMVSVVAKVEEFIKSQIGAEVIEFKKPSHTLEQVRGFRVIKQFMKDEVIPRFRGGAESALTGAVFGGPIGGGKTFLGEAMAAELQIPVLVLTGIRSMWFGETDLIFERLRRVLSALDKVVVFVDEADTQFGQIGEESHSTEKRLTGKIQAMMSDTRLKGKVLWLLMTARIHLLSPDIRRPGRVGDLIVPILDPEGEDLEDFVDWVIEPLPVEERAKAKIMVLASLQQRSAAALATLRSEIKSKKCKTSDAVEAIVMDMLPADIELTRRYQTLQALVNCTKRSLLPKDIQANAHKEKEKWSKELRELELLGIR